jgi:hypothetical protein
MPMYNTYLHLFSCVTVWKEQKYAKWLGVQQGKHGNEVAASGRVY